MNSAFFWQIVIICRKSKHDRDNNLLSLCVVVGHINVFIFISFKFRSFHSKYGGRTSHLTISSSVAHLPYSHQKLLHIVSGHTIRSNQRRSLYFHCIISVDNFAFFALICCSLMIARVQLTFDDGAGNMRGFMTGWLRRASNKLHFFKYQTDQVQ